MDLSLDESQQILVDTFSEMLEKECPTTHVRDHEDTGYSESLWAQYCELGANVMGLPETAGGLEMSLLDLGLVANLSGRALAPVPFLEVATVGRLLAKIAPEHALRARLAEGEPAASIALPRPNAVLGTATTAGGRTLIPFGTIAESVLALDGDALFVAENGKARRSDRVQDIGGGALAHWNLDFGTDALVLATGDDAAAAMRRADAEWKLLAGFWLTGIAQRALQIGSEYARERIQFGVPIGGFQAIAHPLAECAIRTDGAELLCQEAAWADTEDPDRFEMLCSMAFAWGSQTAIRNADIALHTHGGYGFSTEYDIQLFYRRARALSSIAGGATEELQTVAELCFDRDGSGQAPSLLGGAQ
ncbi:MAG: acyl-CoA/acyl-ACP dehydrogenase [bacterium]|nr:acyl-CoA/acyl-ACP dehydrogenase [bacterium]